MPDLDFLYLADRNYFGEVEQDDGQPPAETEKSQLCTKQDPTLNLLRPSIYFSLGIEPIEHMKQKRAESDVLLQDPMTVMTAEEMAACREYCNDTSITEARHRPLRE